MDIRGIGTSGLDPDFTKYLTGFQLQAVGGRSLENAARHSSTGGLHA